MLVIRNYHGQLTCEMGETAPLWLVLKDECDPTCVVINGITPLNKSTNGGQLIDSFNLIAYSPQLNSAFE